MSAFELAGIKSVSGDAGAGARIRAVRGPISQRTFAAALAVHPNTLGRIERGERIPDFDLLKTLCRKFAVNARWLLLGEGPMRAGAYEGVASGPGGLREHSGDGPAAFGRDEVEIDAALFGVILAAIERVHSERGITAPADERGRLTAQIYLDVVAATDDPAARRAMVPAIAASLARFLAIAPTSRPRFDKR